MARPPAEFKFSPFQEDVLEIQQFEQYCTLYDKFKDKYGITWRYLNVELPPNYVGFKNLGPKALAGDWSELAVKVPIVMLILIIAIVVPIFGIFYCMLSYMQKCSTPYASERPAERSFRFVLYILLIFGISLVIPGLYFSYLGMLSLRSMSLTLKSFPNMTNFLDHTAEQYSYIFTKNKDEIIEESKATIALAIEKASTYAMMSEKPYRIDQLKQVLKIAQYMKEHGETKIELNATDHMNIHFIRDLYRLSFRVTADHFMELIEEYPSNKVLYYADYLEGFLNPRVVFDYNANVEKLTELSELLEAEIKALNTAFDACLTTAQAVLKEYGTLVIDELVRYFNEKSLYKDIILEAIAIERENAQYLAKDKQIQVIQIPHKIFYTCLCCMVSIVIIIITLIIGLVVGMLGSRGPRDVFGFNKKTASKILSASVIAIFCIYTLSALAGIKLFFYALVIGNGVCQLDQSAYAYKDNGTRGTTSIFHTCDTTDTAYSKMLSLAIIPPIEFNYNILKNLGEPLFKKWVKAGNLNGSGESQKSIGADEKQRKSSLRLSPIFYEKAEEYDKLMLNHNINEYFNDHAKDINEQLHDKKGTFLYIDNHQTANQSAILMRPCIIENYSNIKRKYFPQLIGTHLHKFNATITKFHNYFPNGIKAQIESTISNSLFELPFYNDTNVFIKATALGMEKLSNKLISKYEAYIDNALTIEIGHCGLLTDNQKTQLKDACACMLDPLGSSWYGYFLALFTLPAILVTSIALSNNFAKVSYDYTPTET